jgi:hypothetical protein
VKRWPFIAYGTLGIAAAFGFAFRSAELSDRNHELAHSAAMGLSGVFEERYGMRSELDGCKPDGDAVVCNAVTQFTTVRYRCSEKSCEFLCGGDNPTKAAK